MWEGSGRTGRGEPERGDAVAPAIFLCVLFSVLLLGVLVQYLEPEWAESVAWSFYFGLMPIGSVLLISWILWQMWFD